MASYLIIRLSDSLVSFVIVFHLGLFCSCKTFGERQYLSHHILTGQGTAARKHEVFKNMEFGNSNMFSGCIVFVSLRSSKISQFYPGKTIQWPIVQQEIQGQSFPTGLIVFAGIL